MPIETPEPPKPSIAALQAMLPLLVGSGGIRQQAPNFAARLLVAPRILSSPGFSYPVYTLGLSDVARGSGVNKGKLVAWRHEFASGDEVVVAEVTAESRPRFTGLNVNSKFRSVQ